MDDRNAAPSFRIFYFICNVSRYLESPTHGGGNCPNLASLFITTVSCFLIFNAFKISFTMGSLSRYCGFEKLNYTKHSNIKHLSKFLCYWYCFFQLKLSFHCDGCRLLQALSSLRKWDLSVRPFNLLLSFSIPIGTLRASSSLPSYDIVNLFS